MHEKIVFTLYSSIIGPSRMAADLPYMSHLAGHMYQVGCLNHRTALHTHSTASVRPFVPLCCTVHNMICRAGGTRGAFDTPRFGPN